MKRSNPIDFRKTRRCLSDCQESFRDSAEATGKTDRRAAHIRDNRRARKRFLACAYDIQEDGLGVHGKKKGREEGETVAATK